MWWIIIGAVIALVVMIILMMIFTGKTADLEKGLSGCESKGGICISANIYTSNGCPVRTVKVNFECAVDSDVCCLGMPVKYGEMCDEDSDNWKCVGTYCYSK